MASGADSVQGGTGEQLTHADRVARGKDARASAPLESHADFPPDRSHDIFLAWTHVKDPDGTDRDYYIRQLKDWKFSAPIERMAPSGLGMYARMCGWTLARAHAQAGDRIALGSYLGSSDKFGQAIADFAEKYADQNELDHLALQAAVRDGTVQATTQI
jgi:hypothetical protein